MSTSTTSVRCEPAPTITEPPATTGRRSEGPSLAESLALGAALLLCVVARLADRVAGALGARDWVPALVVAVAVVSITRSVARLPFILRRPSDHDGPPAPAAGRRAAREAGVLATTSAVGTVVAVPLYALLRATSQWWVVAWAVAAGATVAWQVAAPFLLTARLGSLDAAPGPLAGRLRSLAVRAGVDLPAGVVVAARSANRCANAYVVGLGPTRRVVLEQAVSTWPPELVDQVVAHELGHVRLGHGGRRLPLMLVAQLATLAAAAAVVSQAPLLHLAGVTGVADPGGYPLLLLVGALVVLPARCLLAWNERAQERAADRFALELLGRPDHFVAMLRRAAGESGAPARLPWWRRLAASHPPVDERVAASFDFAPAGSRPPGA